MINKILGVSLLVCLTACSPDGHERNDFTVMPDGLKDCKIYTIRNNKAIELTVMRCPNSSTSTQIRGKHKVNTTTISN